jgi:hypothetical protein
MIMIESKAIINDRLAGVADAEPAIAASGGPACSTGDSVSSRSGAIGFDAVVLLPRS